MNSAHTPESLVALLKQKLASFIVSDSVEHGHAVVKITRAGMFDFFRLIKLDADLSFNMFLSVTVNDWMDQRAERFEVVYHLLSLKHLHRLRVKIDVPEENPEVDSLVSLWSGANFMEREAWDMYGVMFKGHPDLRRILMYDEFKGHPLRKDYPLQAKQPRIQLRAPEVENTARRMTRESLVSINSRSKSADQSGAGK